MTNNRSLEKYIRQEQQASPSSGLTERIMTGITATANENATNKWIQFSGMAASIVIALWLGWHIGGMDVRNDTFRNNVWNINDTEIENLTLYDTANE